MDDGLKQRIIGALVLLALAVIFIPVLFDRERIAPVDKKTQIPVAPYIENTPVVATKEPLNEEPVEPPESIFVPDEKQEVALTPEPISLTDEGTVNSWVLQVASFLHSKNAADFRATLEESGYDSYIRAVNTSKGKRYRVYVGPKLDKNEMITIKSEIEKKFTTQTRLLKFKP